MQGKSKKSFIFITISVFSQGLVEIESSKDFSSVFNGNENDTLWSDR